jgi:dGTPase
VPTRGEPEFRAERRTPVTLSDRRTPGERDRDRILYSAEFRRLANVTQVVGRETRLFHNRLTHSIKVGQLGRRMAQVFREEVSASELESAGGLDPDVVEAGCLAHDLGHPPFGHVGEEALHAFIEKENGFNGNAQSFRIVTKLSFRNPTEPGLNVCRATLNAILKYPWLRGNGKKGKKWGAYRTELATFDFARDQYVADKPSLEAEIMDWADDVTYAVHDLDDFVRAGLVPLDRLRPDRRKTKSREIDDFIKLETQGDDRKAFEAAFDRIHASFPEEPYGGDLIDRTELHKWASNMIRYFTRAPKVERGVWSLDQAVVYEMRVLKELTWHYVINMPALVSAQRGHYRCVDTLCRRLTTWALDAQADERKVRRLPGGLQHLLSLALEDEEGRAEYGNRAAVVRRAVVDFVASLTEDQAMDLFQRLEGGSVASALDTWLRR